MAKIPVKKAQVKVTKKKDEVQLTLETAFEAGKLYKEAKQLKQKALMGQNVIQVGFSCNLYFEMSSLSIYYDFQRGIFWARTSLF